MPPVVAESRSTATRAMRGANSFKSSNDFARRPNSWTENPVTFPPGRARLAIKPPPTGSVAAANTIGMARVTSSRARTQAQPGRELAPTAEAARFYHRGGEGCGNDRADARNARQALADGVALVPGHELLLDRRNRRRQLLNLCGQHL